VKQRDFFRSLPIDGMQPQRRLSISQATHIDTPLLAALLLLSAYGLTVLYSASSTQMHVIERQATFLGIGFAVMIVAAQIPPMIYKRYAPFFYLLGLVLLITVLWKGIGAKGAQRWLALPGLPRFQPSEIMKLAVPIMAAHYFSNRIIPASARSLVGAIIILVIPALLIAKQPDLGTSLLILSSGIFVIFLAGISWRLIFMGAGLAVAAAPALWFTMHDYQKQRVLTFLSPERDPLGSGWNIIQSKTAIGSGGISGKGWLEGTQSHLDFLPESSTDFIIAVLAEEFGLLGAVVLLGLYFFIVARGLIISLEAQDTFSRLLAGSITLTFFVYIFVNIGMVSGILPVVGVPLPLVSVGGTSIVTLMAGFGILMSIQTHRRWLSH
jgi:rod shape determining protein RodA